MGLDGDVIIWRNACSTGQSLGSGYLAGSDLDKKKTVNESVPESSPLVVRRLKPRVRSVGRSFVGGPTADWTERSPHRELRVGWKLPREGKNTSSQRGEEKLTQFGGEQRLAPRIIIIIIFNPPTKQVLIKYICVYNVAILRLYR